MSALGQRLGDLAVTPTRVVLEGRTRSAHVTLINRGNETATYRVSFIHYKMTEEGKLVRLKGGAAEQMSAVSFLRYSPRQVTLAPGGAQSVRVLLRKPRGMAEGEYRSHLYFSAIPKPSSGRDIERRGSGNQVSVRLTIIPGLSIPVIVRHGRLSARASLSDISVRPPEKNGEQRFPAHVAMKVHRNGNRSLFGDVTVTYREAGSGRNFVIARLNRMAVYSQIKFRHVAVPLRLPKGLRLRKGQLHVVYRKPLREGGQVLAEERLVLR